MIRYTPGDIFEADVHAIVNPVNLHGISGAGLAKAFKERYPSCFRAYRHACNTRALKQGTLHVYQTGETTPALILNVPTKVAPRDPSNLDLIRSASTVIAREILVRRIPSIAIPKIGCGLGGLDWNDVHAVLRAQFDNAVYRTTEIRFMCNPPQEPGATHAL